MTRIKAVHSAAMNSAFQDRRTAPHCAYCRRSEVQGRDFVCKVSLPGPAEACASFDDSRKPSTAPPDFSK